MSKQTDYSRSSPDSTWWWNSHLVGPFLGCGTFYFSSQVLDPSLQLALVKGQARAPTRSTACQQQDYQMIIFRSPHLTTTEQGQAREQE